MKEDKVYQAETATGAVEVYDSWQQWPMVRDRYSISNEELCRQIRVFLALGHKVIVEPPS